MSVAPKVHDIQAALKAGDLDFAVELAQAAVRSGRQHPLLFNLVAHALEHQNQFTEALVFLRRGLEMAPSDPRLLTSLGRCLTRLGRRDEALAAFTAALSITPNDPWAHQAIADCLDVAGDVEPARRHYERAVQLAPQWVDPHVSLAALLARTGEPAARAYAERALRLVPGHPDATAALASVEVHEGAYATAETRLRALLAMPGLNPLGRGAILKLLGDAMHGQGRHAEAFEAYKAGNTQVQTILAPDFAAVADRMSGNLARLTAWFEARTTAAPMSAAPYAEGETAGPFRGHVFLVGFPRSGTTLLEHVLASHPDVVALEERPTLFGAEREFLSVAGGLERLAALDTDAAASLREEYWRRVKAFGAAVEGKVFVDKMPLNLVNLPLVARLFPDAKVLLARRDPRDVVLSCFRQMFVASPGAYRMLSLDGAAAFYDAVTRLSELYRETLSLDLHEVRYERFVAEFETETRAVCGFLGLAWDDAMADFAAKSRERTIRTPSAAQVRRGLYRDGEGQWRAYAEQLAPVLPRLAGWVEGFGYAGA